MLVMEVFSKLVNGTRSSDPTYCNGNMSDSRDSLKVPDSSDLDALTLQETRDQLS